LLKLEGVKDVSICTSSGTVKISYIKSQLGCCSKLSSAIEKEGFEFVTISNQEKGANCSKSQKACPGQMKKECSKTHKES
ncbi:MAG: hypothetical protein NZ108_08965, partial [Bacteroidia bacterium]|nr:hypothetical protein [Bacteroidia bacterium]